MTKFLRLLTLYLMLTVAAGPLHAFSNLAGNMAMTINQNRQFEKRLERRNSSTSPNPQQVASLTYTADPTRTQANLQTFISQTANPLAKAELQALVTAQPGIMDDIGTLMRSAYGLDRQNTADAYAIWLVAAWNASQKIAENPAPAMLMAVRNQVAGTLLATPEFLASDDAARQLFAEAHLMEALIMSETTRAMQGDPASLNSFAATAVQNARNAGVDLQALRLTPNGFVLR
ncbi:MAG: hypothetical protein AAGM21_13750 [Pseudomonadota bacterium]